ncbi:PREDICTED: gamma carbonic anhydrase 2, mitochondrial-like [Ipomoea nil]|uniref:gamma carbonic anhydrase 2, mitochondrial-like n=1 Tax=Ipomoea nil TaxID=35883 RepID=UPI0009009251|nr:PREDICTED: gamma carbonic anhydrase 2, mitochondrial-like [Ipomoea nil]
MGSLGKAIYTLGSLIRGSGKALDRIGCGLQGSYYLSEQLSRHRTLMDLFDKSPVVDKDAFVAPGASVIGDVQVGRNSSIWYGCVLRGDVNRIRVGAGTNIQDNSLVHVAKLNSGGRDLPTIIGDNVTIGHSAVIHACTIDDEAFVGMGAILLDGVHLGKHAMVAAGALVRQNTKIPSGEIWAGNPAKFLRKLTEEEVAFISQSATTYTNLARVHAAENSKSFDEIEFERMLRKKYARRDEDYDSMIGVVRETPPELVLPDNILPDKAKSSNEVYVR